MKHTAFPIRPEVPRCDSLAVSQAARDRGETRRCKMPAKYTINGRNLCPKHAGAAALSILMKETT